MIIGHRSAVEILNWRPLCLWPLDWYGAVEYGMNYGIKKKKTSKSILFPIAIPGSVQWCHLLYTKTPYSIPPFRSSPLDTPSSNCDMVNDSEPDSILASLHSYFSHASLHSYFSLPPYTATSLMLLPHLFPCMPTWWYYSSQNKVPTLRIQQRLPQT